MKNKKERSEALMRIIVGVVSGFILYVWSHLIGIFIIVNFFYTLITGKRSKDIANLCEIFNSQLYAYSRYMGFVSNERPFPFEKLTKDISKFK